MSRRGGRPTHPIGFIEQFRTHRIKGLASSEPFVLSPPEIEQANPFWVVSAAKQVIEGHNGIWQAPFLSFLRSIVFQHVVRSKVLAAAAPSLNDVIVAKNVAAPARGGDLAKFPRGIDG